MSSNSGLDDNCPCGIPWRFCTAFHGKEGSWQDLWPKGPLKLSTHYLDPDGATLELMQNVADLAEAERKEAHRALMEGSPGGRKRDSHPALSRATYCMDASKW